MSTRRASDGNRTAARASDDADFRQTVHTAPDNGHEHSSEEQHTPGPVAPQVSEKEVARLEADNDRMHRSNEVKNMVFEAIYAQLPEKIQGEMSECGVGWQKKDSGFKFSDLSEAELKRLTKWLLEQKPFAELKEFELEDPEKCPVEEETDGAVDCMAVFPAAQVAPVRASQGCGQVHSTGKKRVQRTGSVLGSGTYGKVSIVKHKGQCYAAKELKLEDSGLVGNLYREAANLALLDDDNIVKFCGIGRYERHHTQGVFLILTELLATSLHRYLMTRAVISVPNLVSVLSDVLSGLEYMHQDPTVIHGDLKTRNILLTEKGIAKIGDLGSAQLANDCVVGRMVYGTEAYMSPETASREYTKKMDVFAYGHLSLVTLTRWEIDPAEFSTPQHDSISREVDKRKKLFAKLNRPAFAVVSNFVPLIRACLSDTPSDRPPLDELKEQMEDLILPRELPLVQTDTAVRRET